MTYPWSDLKFWQSGEFQLVRERLDDERKAGFSVNPDRTSLFKALSATPLGEVKVVCLGQDPYPEPRYATGLAFSIPETIDPADFPASLRTIFKEYVRDLGYPSPSHGNLSRWAAGGVLLWNTIPSCRAGKSLSHDWRDGVWDYLTREIIERCDDKGVVFVFVGAVAKRHLGSVKNSPIIQVSHPSPRGQLNTKSPFVGSRLFTTINDKLREIGLEPVDWRLDDPPGSQEGGPRGEVLRGPGIHGKVPRILENITGADCGPLYHTGKVDPRKRS